MHARLQVRLLNRSLALGVCESMETMAVPSPKRRKSRADRALVVPPRMPSEPKPIPSDRSDETRDAMATGV